MLDNQDTVNQEPTIETVDQQPDSEAAEQPAVEQTASAPAPVKKKTEVRGELLFWRIAGSALLLAVIALGVLLHLSIKGMLFQPEKQVVSYTAWCYTPLEEPITVTADEDGTLILPDGPEISGYTFIGWRDSEGKLVANSTQTLYSDAAYSAEYAIAFLDEGHISHHSPFFLIDDEGRFRPFAPVSRAQTVWLLYESLDTSVEGSGSFVDVDPTADYYIAAATLKDLGVFSESRFHPDDPITHAEFFDMLAHFFPASHSSYAFASISESDPRYGAFCLAMDRGWISDLSVAPDADLTRAEAAHIFNLLRGRTVMADVDYSKIGTIMDVSFSDPYFADIAEAAIAHDIKGTDGAEIWTSSEALPLREEGLFFIGTALHCIDERGGVVINGSYGNFDFGPDGVITTGMPELDQLVQDTLVMLKLKPETMTGEQMLHMIFNYVTYHNSYLRDGNHIHAVGETGWENEEAYKMLSTHKGNCYNYAAEFYVLAKAIGYDAVIYSGTIDPTKRPHGWVEIEFDGEPYIFDTEIEFKEVTIGGHQSSYYKVPYWKAKTWYYNRGEES